MLMGSFIKDKYFYYRQVCWWGQVLLSGTCMLVGSLLGTCMLVGSFIGVRDAGGGYNGLSHDLSDYEQCILNTTIQKVEEE